MQSNKGEIKSDMEEQILHKWEMKVQTHPSIYLVPEQKMRIYLPIFSG